MNDCLEFSVPGLPAPQGSKRHVGKGVMIESSKHVKPWREAVKWAAKEAMEKSGWNTEHGHVYAVMSFYFARPKSHYGTGKNAAVLKEDAPDYVGKKPDLSKLVRSTEDALVDVGAIKDDSLIVEMVARKEFGDNQGAKIQLWVKQ